MILFLIGQLGMGGQEQQLYYLVKGLKARKINMAVAVWDYHETDHWVDPLRRLEIEVMPVSGGSIPGKLIYLRRLVSKVKPDIVHSYSFPTNFCAWAATVGNRNIKALGSLRSSRTLALQSAGMLRGGVCIRYPRMMICNSYAAADECEASKWPLRPGTVRVISNCTDLEVMGDIKSETSESLRIIGIGRLGEEKRWDLFLKVLSSLKKEKGSIIGGIYGDGPMMNELNNIIENTDLNGVVSLMGRKDKKEIFSNADVLLHTAETEGMPNVILEAMAAGKIVIATRVGDIDRYVEDGKSGYLVEPGDTEMMKERLIYLDENRSLLEEVGKAAKAKASELCSMNRMVDATLDIYKEIGFQAG